ncbi:UDP-N-acetyl-D-mannosamine dehydrogenase [Phorcysia thermohydrogeniphila]|uniref:UDP-N-acetyl-D-mannosaminuronic acid dehydrogenase n=1 Tax=Phorcysia thermohydrogeniphila TaxID=936138 RepID=A0A4R1GF92_9BACT|nr:UDP-N-acetyl-D-mannosamine dehydrogenase [Phorcysia thermohydrogeniphila]TCK04449.1 UDP-N-acetyl-D-mannosaminuronic acid dehydrogenase [Phorcysia thermohydrogeniphila]
MKPEPLTVVIMGLGYIGLPTAALIASKGINVYGVDINKSVVDTINEGKIHIVEPDLDGLVHEVVRKGLLKASTSPTKADVFLIAVPTPFKEGHIPDISFVEAAIKMITPYLEEGNLVIIESTSPIGTTEKMYDLITSERPELKNRIYMAYCPERVLPGKILYELQYNDRVIGGINPASAKRAKEFYSLFVEGELHETNAKTAEMCKLVENAYRDVNIAFANELSLICDKAGIDVWELIELANKHPRVNILQPGVGVGGHCIAVDPWFLITHYPEESKLIKVAREVNLYKTEWVIKKIKEKAKEFEENYSRKPKIACLGLTYKPDIDDLRESPALYIVRRLIAEGYRILAVEPYVDDFSEFHVYETEEALKEADIVAILVAHRQFRNLRIEKNKLLDFCGIVGNS